MCFLWLRLWERVSSDGSGEVGVEVVVGLVGEGMEVIGGWVEL